MGKRFTDTAIWDKEWFMKLSPEYKCAFMYIKDKCDPVGVWDPNFTLAEMQIQGDINWEGLPEKFSSQIEVLEGGKWWIKDFVSFQYGELTDTCNPHKKYIELLKKHGLYERVLKGYKKGSYTLQEKEEEKEQEQEEVLNKKYKGKKYSIHSTEQWDEEQPIDYRSFIDFFNQSTGGNCRLTDNKYPDIKKQLKTFTGAEIKKALVNRSLALADSEYLTGWESVFSRKPERMEKYLTMKTENINGQSQKNKPTPTGEYTRDSIAELNS